MAFFYNIANISELLRECARARAQDISANFASINLNFGDKVVWKI